MARRLTRNPPESESESESFFSDVFFPSIPAAVLKAFFKSSCSST